MALTKTQEVNMTSVLMTVETESGDVLFVPFAYDAATPGAKDAAGALALERIEEDVLETMWVVAYCLGKGTQLYLLQQLPPGQQARVMREKGFSKEGTTRTKNAMEIETPDILRRRTINADGTPFVHANAASPFGLANAN